MKSNISIKAVKNLKCVNNYRYKNDNKYKYFYYFV